MSEIKFLGCGQLPTRRIERAFEISGEGDIADRSARQTDQMVMVLGEIFSEFIVCMIRRMHEPAHHPSLLHERQISIGRTLGQSGGTLEQFGKRDGRIDVCERLNDGPTRRGVPLVPLTETISGDAMHLSDRRPMPAMAPMPRLVAGVTHGVLHLIPIG